MEQLNPDPSSKQMDFRLVMAEWELWLTETSLGSHLPLAATRRMLESAVCRGTTLANIGYDMDVFVSRASSIRVQMLERLAADLQSRATKFALPPLVATPTGIDGSPHSLPTLHLPSPLSSQTAMFDLNACRLRAAGNLGSQPIPDFQSFPPPVR